MIHPSTVGQLISELQKLDPNAEIGVGHPNHDLIGSWSYERIIIESKTAVKTGRNGWRLRLVSENLEQEDETKQVLVIS